MSGLFKTILIRHDLVHRNGKTKEGTDHILRESEITDLIIMAETFVSEIERRWQEAKSNNTLQGKPDDEPEF
jgi:hypothetical protein